MNFEVSELNKLNLPELKEVLKDLTLYKSLVKQLWNRWRRQYNKLKTWEKTLLVEYFSALDKDYVLEESMKIFEKVFGIKNIDSSSIKLIEKDTVQWGMRLFVDDKVLDLTYSKIEKQFAVAS